MRMVTLLTLCTGRLYPQEISLELKFTSKKDTEYTHQQSNPRPSYLYSRALLAWNTF